MPADIIKRTNAAPTTVHSWKKPDLSSPCIVERSNGWLDGRTDREIRFWPIGKASFCSPTITSHGSPRRNHRPGHALRVQKAGSSDPRSGNLSQRILLQKAVEGSARSHAPWACDRPAGDTLLDGVAVSLI